MHYIAKFAPDDGGLLVTFPAVPEAITGGADEAEAIANAIDALEVALLTYAKDGLPLPVPTSKRPAADERAIVPSAATAAKLAFITAFAESRLTRVALAAQLGKAEGEVRRMLDPYHATKLPALEAGLRALGKRLVVTVEAA
ncbi:MAG TPA: type II toxin-antitoxin system HicB family antitoxin [Devosia sp.]